MKLYSVHLTKSSHILQAVHCDLHECEFIANYPEYRKYYNTSGSFCQEGTAKNRPLFFDKNSPPTPQRCAFLSPIALRVGRVNHVADAGQQHNDPLDTMRDNDVNPLALVTRILGNKVSGDEGLEVMVNLPG